MVEYAAKGRPQKLEHKGRSGGQCGGKKQRPMWKPISQESTTKPKVNAIENLVFLHLCIEYGK